MIRSKIFYSLSKYVTYGLKFVQALFIAKCLGPVGLAVYGFAQLIALYCSFINFGVPTAIHTLLSISSDKDTIKSETYISVGFSLILVIGVVLCIASTLVMYLFPSLFAKFHFSEFGIASVIIGINLIIVQLFANIYQVYGQYVRIALNDLSTVLLLFVFVFLFRDNREYLLKGILFVSASTLVFNLFFFLYKAPFKIVLSLQGFVLKSIIKMGIPMLITNVGFYLIIISVRTISSYYYNLHDIGLFTLGLNIANTVLMGLNAIGWTYYSTVLANTCNDVDEAYEYVQKVNRIYNFVLCLTIYLGILCLPVIFYFLPAYKEFSIGFSILFLAQIFTSLSFGYGSMLVAQKKQNTMAWISFFTLIFTIILSVLVCFFKMPFLFQTVVILASMFFYSLQVCYAGARVCKKDVFKVLFVDVHNFKVLIPILISLFALLVGLGFWWILVVITVYFILSYRDILYLVGLLRGLKTKAE